MAIIKTEIEEIPENIICSGKKLSLICKEIDNRLFDCFKQISTYMNDPEGSIFFDPIEELEGLLIEIQDLITLIN